MMIQQFKILNWEKKAAFKEVCPFEIDALEQMLILASLPPYVLLIPIR